ncbi:hypothetical protein LTS17_007473 [Exophiala oligosperma]
MRVSSKILILSSPVFKAMLTGPFREGQLILSNDDPPILDLPEDDPQAMELMFRILHHDPTVHDYQKCYYNHDSEINQLAPVIRLWFHGYLSAKHIIKEEPDFCRLASRIGARYMMDAHDAFNHCTKTAIETITWHCYDTRDPDVKGHEYLATSQEDFDPRLLSPEESDRLYAALETAFDITSRRFIDLCMSFIGRLFQDDGSIGSSSTRAYISTDEYSASVGKNCESQDTRITEFTSSLVAFGLWPGDPSGENYQSTASKKSLRATIEIVRKIAQTHMNDLSVTCGNWGCKSCSVEWGVLIEDEINKFESSSIHGLCLVCFKKSGENISNECAGFGQECLKHRRQLQDYPYGACTSA